MSLKLAEIFGKNLLFLGALLLLVEQVAAKQAAAASTPANSTNATTAAPMCNRKLIQSYGLVGSDQPLAYPMDLCPTMLNSCCQPADQKIIYDLWKNKNISGNIDFMFSTFEKVYDGMFEAVNGIQTAATNFYKLNKKKTPTACIALGKRLTFFDFAGVRSRVTEQVKLMHKFFKQTYQSFYCTICDASLQKFVNVDAKKVTYSKSFCRSIVNNSLSPMMYLHGHMRRYINLVNKFMLYCDVYGNYKNVPVPAEAILKIDSDIVGNLTKCKQDRNEPTWFDSCRPICEKFNHTAHATYFAPFLNGFLNATAYMNQKLADFQNSGQNKLAGMISLYSQKRNLKQAADTGAGSKSNSTNCTLGICIPKSPFVIYPTAKNASVSNFGFKVEFNDTGIPVEFIAKDVQMIEVSDARIAIMSNPTTAAQAQAAKKEASPAANQGKGINGTVTSLQTANSSAGSAAGKAKSAGRLTVLAVTLIAALVARFD